MFIPISKRNPIRQTMEKVIFIRPSKQIVFICKMIVKSLPIKPTNIRNIRNTNLFQTSYADKAPSAHQQSLF